jgi:hypothetical protein
MNQLAGQTLGSPPLGYPGGKSAGPFLADYATDESERNRLGISARSTNAAVARSGGSAWTGATDLAAPAESSDQAPVDRLGVSVSPIVAGAARIGLANGERP